MFRSIAVWATLGRSSEVRAVAARMVACEQQAKAALSGLPVAPKQF